MPRVCRRLSESKVYHVMIRGNEKKCIFIDDKDRNKFIDIIDKKSSDKKFMIYAFCLMSNHVHLLINEGEDNISRIMKCINVPYVYYFNKRHGRVGHLFQDRFKSEAIEDERYLLAVVRYIHNNPVKAGLSTDPSKYIWSSYNTYINSNAAVFGFIKCEPILGYFSENKDEAIKKFIEFSKNESDVDENFIDEPEESEENEVKSINNEEEAVAFINNFLRSNSIKMEDIHNKSNIFLRTELIKNLKKKSKLSVRQIAGILKIDRNTVQRIK